MESWSAPRHSTRALDARCITWNLAWSPGVGPDIEPARCTRDTSTPGMCLSEQRIEGADLTFRFPRDWLTQWRDIASAMNRLSAQMHSAKG